MKITIFLKESSWGVRFLGLFLFIGGIIFTPLFFSQYCVGIGLNLYGITFTAPVVGAIFCGIGLLKLNNHARQISLCLMWSIGLLLLYELVGMTAGDSPNINKIFGGIFIWLLFYGWIVIAITIFLLNPNVKRQFIKP